jgi:hypothetical protein
VPLSSSSVDEILEHACQNGKAIVSVGSTAHYRAIDLKMWRIKYDTPDFTLSNPSGQPVSLAGLLRGGPAVVTFSRERLEPDGTLRALRPAATKAA